MAEVKIRIDTKQVEDLGFDFRQMAIAGLHRTVERGEQLLRDEVPKVTHNLSQGISSEVDEAKLEGRLLVAARTARREAQGASLHLASGKTVEITLRARPAFDYAEAVARGTGIYGPRAAVINPKNAKALLIPVSGPPAALNGKPQSYITSGGQTFIVRRFTKGRKADPYDVRAAQRLEAEVDRIWDGTIKAFANQEKQ